jgi:hypothetical protein
MPCLCCRSSLFDLGGESLRTFLKDSVRLPKKAQNAKVTFVDVFLSWFILAGFGLFLLS